ncbi:MAG: helix-turn-helix domain-containing protein [Solirubrobacteraceae bacterium]
MSTVEAYKEELSQLLRAFGANARRLREMRQPSCSQERLSYISGLHRTEIGRLELGAVEPRLTTLLILAEGLDVTIDELLRGLTAPSERKPAATRERW